MDLFTLNPHYDTVSNLDTEKNEAVHMGKKEKADKGDKGKATAPGQLKKAAGEKSAKSFAPGQKKEKKEKGTGYEE